MIPLYLIFAVAFIGLLVAGFVILRGLMEDIHIGNFWLAIGGLFVLVCIICAIAIVAGKFIEVLAIC